MPTLSLSLSGSPLAPCRLAVIRPSPSAGAAVRQWSLAAVLAALIASAAAAQVSPQGSTPLPIPAAYATVYRDFHGLPHIVANDEASAWYALGYEQARDALLWIQYACKAAKGELTWVRGADGLFNDLAVQIFNAHGRLTAMSVAQRRALFAPTNPNIQANFYDNCAAFAAGADAFRLAVQNAPATPLTPERRLRNWLDQHSLLGPAAGTSSAVWGQGNLAWIYQHPIEAVDVAAQGAWTTATMSIVSTTASTLVNSVGPSYGIVSGSGGPGGVDPASAASAPDPFTPGSIERWLEPMRQQLSLLPGAPSAFAGSNTFAWSGDHCRDASPGTASYAGLLGDPHQSVPNYAPNFPQGFKDVPNHLWVAHVQVTPQGAAFPSLDVLGHVPYASAAFFTSHNRFVAMGGTFGGPNHFDTFLLRLREDPQTGLAASPLDYYSHYHDSGNTNTTWRQITGDSIQVKRWDNATVTLDYWRADSFGVILPNLLDAGIQLLGGPAPTIPVAYGDRIDPSQQVPPRWRVGLPPDPEPMRFWNDPQPNGSGSFLTSPMVVALRAPIDAAVAGEDMHWQLLRDFWEIAHATQISDVIGRTNGAAYLANLCFVDRAGRTFSTQCSAIPERGDDAQLFAALYHSVDKWAIYNKALPVPARHFDDRKFDWQFGSHSNPAHPTQLHYLQYPTVLPPTGPFKPATFQDPVSGFTVPPTSFPASGPFQVESGFFASACNDLIWGFSRKRDSYTTAGNGFNTWSTPGNQLFQWALDAGVVYQTRPLGVEAADRQQIVVDRFTRQYERIVRGGSAGLPPLTPAQMRDFVVTPELYHEDSYSPPIGVTANTALPTPIRQLQEVVHPQNASHAMHPLLAAQEELQFFNDLWTTLFSTQWDQHQVVGASPSLQVSLRDLWLSISGGSVGGHQNQIFWYSDLQNPVPSWIDLPPEFPLIDFILPENEVSRGVTAGTVDPNGLSGSELNTLGSLVAELVNWDPAGPHYRNVPTSPGACLLEMMRMGYNAKTGDANHDFGRHWVRLKGGQVEFIGSPTNTWSTLTSTGQIPAGGTLVRQNRPWNALSELAFPGGQLATLFRDMPPYIQDAIAALYDPVTLQVRATLRPEDTNALVKFFLSLGGHYIDEDHNQGNPSTKLARYQRLADPQSQANTEARFLASLPARYPLTEGLQRLTVLRALLDTKVFLQTISPAGTPAYSQCFRSRAYDHTGQIWPALPPPPATTSDNDCVGASLRSVVWHEDTTDPGHAGWRGFQPKFLGIGGSIATLLALFPSNSTEVHSYFWCTPGIEVMTSDPARFDAHMNAFSTNTLLWTHYDDFLNPNNIAWSVVHYP